MKRALTVLVAILLFIPAAFAQKKQITLETLYNPTTRVYFSGAVQSGFEWLDDSTFIWPKTDEKGELIEWERFDANSGRTTPLFDVTKLERALVEAGVGEPEAKTAARRRSQTFDARKSAVVLDAAGDLFVYSLSKQTATRLTSSPSREEVATFSPDGQRVAFVRDNNLFVVDVAGGRERQLTTDGNEQLLNGRLDWVYDEEVYGRGTRIGYWWSPDSKRIAFLQLDEKAVPVMTIVDHIPYHPAVQRYPYPKAGDPNPLVKLMVVPATGGDVVTVDHERYSAIDHLIMRVAWNRDSSAVLYQVANREQTWMDLNSANPSRGGNKTLFRETTKAWVDAIDNPEFLPDGTFLWQSERSGFRHIYLYKPDGTLIRQITNGDWEVRALHGYDPKSRTVYFSGTERTPIGLDVYHVNLDGTALQRISDKLGTHSAKFNPAMTMYVDNWSDATTPNQARLHRADGTLAKIVSENLVPLLGEYDITAPQFLQVKARDGFVMEALLIKPANFDPAKKYPVYEYHYGGPHAQQVVNSWGGTGRLFQQMIANQGVVVWLCDNRAASGKGAVSAWTVYKHLGDVELRDMEDGLAWLKTNPWIDGSRIMTDGWSYGGYMTSYAMTHSKSFIAGIAGGTVSDWRDYDSIYTERYMLMPQNNPDGYKNSSPRWAAKELSGRILLLHGTIDDNVHLQNTIQFIDELEKAGKPFDMRLYPRSQHGVRDPVLNQDRQRTILEFIRKNLLR
jgi:dipeptidyl-peptidase 4